MVALKNLAPFKNLAPPVPPPLPGSKVPLSAFEIYLKTQLQIEFF